MDSRHQSGHVSELYVAYRLDGHGRCSQMYAGPECPYCEVKTVKPLELPKHKHDNRCLCPDCRYEG